MDEALFAWPPLYAVAAGDLRPGDVVWGFKTGPDRPTYNLWTTPATLARIVREYAGGVVWQTDQIGAAGPINLPQLAYGMGVLIAGRATE